MWTIRNYYFKFTIVIFSYLYVTNPVCLGQYFVQGVDPASVRWMQIKTPNFKVIYPLSFEKHAQHIANSLEYNYHPDSRTISSYVPRMPLILHNQTTIPSSVTPYAPRRIDFFTTPSQDIYPQDWIDQLIIHEFRHASQYSAVNHGFTKGLSYVLGEQGTFASIALFVPIWFLEGDAVSMETALHHTGRGRTPSFEMRLRAQFVQKGIYSYEKATEGSYLNFVPGKYDLGYQLVGLSKEKYGSDLWSKVLSNVGRHPYTLTPFSSELNRQTGFNKYGLYHSLTSELRDNWLKLDHQIQENDYQIIAKAPKKEYTNYNLPVCIRDGSIVSVKSSMNDLTKVVLLHNNGHVETLFKTGIYNMSESMSTSDDMLCWSEMTNDPRWSFRDYRVIKAYHFKTGKITQLTRKTRYYAPSITRDGKFIVAVEITLYNSYFLVILNAGDGRVIKRITTPDNFLFIHPQWAPDGKSIVSVVIGKKGNSLALTDPETGKFELLMPFSFLEIKRPSFYSNHIIYNASYNGIDNIYALDLLTHDVSQVTSARFGASDACLTTDQSAIIYSNYTADGYQLVKESLNPEKWKPISVPAKSAFPIAEKLTQQENFIFNTDSVPKAKYKSRPYHKAWNLFNFHSWMPVGVDFQNVTASPGITLLSQNLLGTNITTLGYLWDRNQQTGKYVFLMSNQSLYPAIDLNLDYGDRHDILHDTIPLKWKETNISAGLRLPLRWSHNIWWRSFQPAVKMNYKYLNMDKSVPESFTNNQVITLGYSIQASNLMNTSTRDLFPRFGQQLLLNFNHTTFESKLDWIYAGQVYLDFPGILKHHGLRLYGAYQKKSETDYSFSDFIVFPRGYDNIFRDELASFSALYSLPLFLPDWQLGHFMYIKRIKTAFFYDYAQSRDLKLPDVFSSTGIDLSMDFSLFNFIAPFDAGIRSIYIPETGQMKFQLLFSLNLNSIY